jgi:hypothetical protein
MTQPTSEIMKLNFITDQGSIRDTASWALRVDAAPPAGAGRWGAGRPGGRWALPGRWAFPGRGSCGRDRGWAGKDEGGACGAA